MRTTKLALAFLFAALVLPAFAAAAEAGRASVRAILIAASKDRGPSDPKLAPYEATLRSNLRFESFRYLGEASATVAAGGSATLNLAGGQKVEVEGERGNGPNVRVRVLWAGVTVPISPGRPAVVGGRPWGDKGEVAAIIVIAN